MCGISPMTYISDLHEKQKQQQHSIIFQTIVNLPLYMI